VVRNEDRPLDSMLIRLDADKSISQCIAEGIPVASTHQQEQSVLTSRDTDELLCLVSVLT
jgi:hypothetical protein